MNNLILIAIMLGLSFFNETDTKIVTEPKTLIEEKTESETVIEEKVKEGEIQLFIDSEISSEINDVGFEFTVDGYEILSESTIILFSHSVNKDAIKDLGSIGVRMNWELEDGRTGGWEKNVYTKVNSVSYEEQRKTTFPIITEITDISELNNAHLNFLIRISKPI